ncbi:MAG: beta-lactamase family protein [Armatimonadetes bacterium]|nr:beta-lactamase family protein [Armatimonadota bacterium]
MTSLTLLALLLLATACLARPVSGPDSPANPAYDQVIGELMDHHKVPCGAVAVAVLKLVEEGRLKLDDPVLDLIVDLVPPDGPTDPRWRAITVRHLLHHTGGWDRGVAFDPMFRPIDIAREMGEPAPAGPATIIRYMLRQPLQHDPGTQYAYSNFGYCVLGRIIERLTGRTYEGYVKDEILRTAGITDMRIGRSLRAFRAPGEGWYAMPEGAHEVPAVFPYVSEQVPIPYGAWHLEAMDAHGAWIASPVDLVRFALHCDNRPDPPDLLHAASYALLTERPAPPLPQTEAAYYGLGWQVRPTGNDANWWHSGSLDGTASILVRTGHGYVWAAIFNARSNEGDINGAMDQAMWQALGKVTAWPAEEVRP